MDRRQKPRYRKAEKLSVKNPFPLVAALIGVVVLAILGTFLLQTAASPTPELSEQNVNSTDGNENTDERRVSFIAVGDNLPEIQIGTYADACAGELNDDEYDYSPIFAPIKPYIERSDLAYISFETHAGGDDIGLRGYPSFNTSDAMVDAVYDTGFNMIASATNHSYDWGLSALTHSAELWKQKPVLFTGTAVSEEDASTIKTIEKNGMVFALLNYTYGVNGYAEEDIPAYAINYTHEDRIVSDIARAKEESDVVIVSMHLVTELFMGIYDTQLYYAQLIADAGADLVLGSHPHVIGPLAWVEGVSGNQCLVAYSLGNFLSRHEIAPPEVELGGMLNCTFVKDETGVHIENLVWSPLVNHYDGESFAVYPLQDYSPKLASVHPTLASLEDPIAWIEETTLEVVGPIPKIVLSK